MRDLDETDLEILRLLLSDARRPYSDIAEAVDLSPPAVSDRVARLEEAGVIRRFTLDLDRSQLREGIPLLVRLHLGPGGGTVGSVRETLLDAGTVEHVFTTAEADLVCYARAPDTDVGGWLADTLGPDALEDGTVEGFEVTLLSGVEWSPDLGGAAFALSCAECGNTVDSEGVAARIDGDLYQFCCPSCESRFEEAYTELKQGAD
ncbi:winged helix-turn-helix transcriptional regulator [Salinirubellus sp. GCM10025818]|jgi:DNA-binding Lrp family transcriptional regulator|uniref:winged helix-turn-helix transcriptional regulator n=1 Tax=Salinirubellus TaxID=2162630 RepID=UPI0030D135E6